MCNASEGTASRNLADSKGRIFDNIFTKRLWRSVKYEEVYIKDYSDVREAKKA